MRGQNKPYMLLPYVMGLSESIKNISNKHSVQVQYKGGNTIKGLLMTPQDKGQITMTSDIIYRFKCQSVDSNDEYIGESSRFFLVRGLGNINRPLLQCMTTVTSQVMIPLFQISALLGERIKMSPKP